MTGTVLRALTIGPQPGTGIGTGTGIGVGSGIGSGSGSGIGRRAAGLRGPAAVRRR